MSKHRSPRFSGLRNGDLMRVSKRVTMVDVLDIAAFCFLAVVLLFGVLAI